MRAVEVFNATGVSQPMVPKVAAMSHVIFFFCGDLHPRRSSAAQAVSLVCEKSTMASKAYLGYGQDGAQGVASLLDGAFLGMPLPLPLPCFELRVRCS